MDGAVQALIDFAHANEPLIFWLVLALATAEATVIVSIFFPTTAILIGLGALVAVDALAFGPIFAGAAIGAVLGSTLSWWLGRQYGDRLMRVWPLSRHPETLLRGLDFIRRRGASGVLIGHFVGALRPIVFVVAGMSRLALWKFTAWNVGGAMVWAFVVPKSGELGGDVIGWLWRAAGGA
jgi:membrane protein DedA with SNARE-associated domain